MNRMQRLVKEEMSTLASMILDKSRGNLAVHHVDTVRRPTEHLWRSIKARGVSWMAGIRVEYTRGGITCPDVWIFAWQENDEPLVNMAGYSALMIRTAGYVNQHVQIDAADSDVEICMKLLSGMTSVTKHAVDGARSLLTYVLFASDYERHQYMSSLTVVEGSATKLGWRKNFLASASVMHAAIVRDNDHGTHGTIFFSKRGAMAREIYDRVSKAYGEGGDPEEEWSFLASKGTNMEWLHVDPDTGARFPALVLAWRCAYFTLAYQEFCMRKAGYADAAADLFELRDRLERTGSFI